MRARLRIGIIAGILLLAVAIGIARRPAPAWRTWRPEPVTLPSPNGFGAVVAAAEKAWDLPESQQGDKETAAGRAKSAERSREAVEMLRQALPLPYVEPPNYGVAAMFPHYSKMRKLAGALAVRARWHDDRGEAAEAMRCRLDAAELGAHLPHGAPMLGTAVGIACEAKGRADAARAVDRLSGPEAKAAAQRLEAIDASRVRLPEAVASARRYELASMAELLDMGSLRGLASATDSGTGKRLRAFSTMLLAGGKGGMWRQYVRFQNDCVKAAAEPVGHRRWPERDRYGPLTAHMAMDWSRSAYGLDRCQTGDHLWLAALALRAYQAEHGQYPATLDALVPAYLKAVPADGFAPGPLHYELRGGQPLLYSVGPDGVDNQGAPVPAKTARGGLWDQESLGDVVWGVTRI